MSQPQPVETDGQSSSVRKGIKTLRDLNSYLQLENKTLQEQLTDQKEF